jgi:hypothetical protein
MFNARLTPDAPGLLLYKGRLEHSALVVDIKIDYLLIVSPAGFQLCFTEMGHPHPGNNEVLIHTALRRILTTAQHS